MTMERMNIRDFPVLSNILDWGPVQATFAHTEIVDESLTSNVSIIPCFGDQYVMIQIENGKWELPGGTLEDGERYTDALKREMMEELGGRLVSYQVFGKFDCVSTADKPYRPYIPHPKFIRIVGYGEVELVCQPLNPEDGEQVIKVETVQIDEAIARLEACNRHDIAELYKLAHQIRTGQISK